MSRITDFGECLYHKDLQCLYALLHCLHRLHEEYSDDTARLADHLDKRDELILRRCDLCGENLARHTIWEMLQVVKSVIHRREDEMEKAHELRKSAETQAD